MSTIRTIKAGIISGAVILTGLAPLSSPAAEYDIDTNGMHAFVQFKVKHLGVSLLLGRFNDFSGTFSWDQANPGAAAADVTIQTASVDTNHEARDKHIRSDDFFNVEIHPTVTFKSTGYKGDAKSGTLMGNLTLNGVTKEISIAIQHIGEGKDPWGGYRAGFEGHTTLTSADFGTWKSGAMPKTIDMDLYLEGKQKK